jgi:DNA-binding HxlR family transcriptional regulator
VVALASDRPNHEDVGAEATSRVDLAICPLPNMTDMPQRQPEARAEQAPTPLELALERVGDRWSLLLVEALLDGPRRFNELGDAVAGIAPNILADRLRRLEREGVVLARPYTDRPPRMEYALTAAGRELAGALRLLADWGARRADDVDPVRHDLCGTPLEARWYCPTCTVLVDEGAAIETPII